MDLRKLSASQLEAEMARRRNTVAKLLRKREQIAAQIAALDGELAALGMAVPTGDARRPTRGGRRRTGAGNAESLADTLAGVVDVGTRISPKEAAERVRARGYTTTSKTFAVQVANVLANDERFTRIARGVYERVG